jgi:hypothetical protein
MMKFRWSRRSLKAEIEEAKRIGATEERDYLRLRLIAARENGAFDGARFSLGTPRRPSNFPGAVGWWFRMEDFVYDAAYAKAKTETLAALPPEEES